MYNYKLKSVFQPKLRVEDILLNRNELIPMEEINHMDENITTEMNHTVNVADGNTQTEMNRIDLNSTLVDIPLKCIQFSSQLGGGKFGKVFKAQIKGIDGDVAVKTERGILYTYDLVNVHN